MTGETLLTGTLALILVISAALTLPVSLFLLWLYRRAVLRGMGQSAGASAAPSIPTVAPITPSPRSYPQPLERVAAQSLRRAVVVTVLAGLAFAAVFALAWAVNAEGGFRPVRFAWLWVAHAWPTALAVGLVAALGARNRLLIAGAYFAVAASVGLLTVAASPQVGLGDLAFFWLLINGPPSVLLLAFLARPVRAVGPLVLAFTLAGVSGALLLTQAAGSSDDVLRALVDVFSTFGLGAESIFLFINLLGFALMGALGWLLLRWVGERYRRKRTSDLAITLDALWLAFAVIYNILLTFEGLAWAATGLVAFSAYLLVTRIGNARATSHTPRTPAQAPMLLLLRVFALGRRSQRLFDAMSKLWLRAGSISMIAGPDLVTTTVEPHEFLAFVGGKLSRQFVQGEADLNQRLAALDTSPDPDGRFRVNEFFCRDDTWQMTMRRLAARSDAVLMDLRSFSPANRGSTYEIEQLVQHVPLAQIVLVVDDTTDRSFLNQTLQAAWQSMPPHAANRGITAPQMKLFHARSGVGTEARALCALLFSMSA